MDMPGSRTKPCKKCQTVKPLDEFYRHAAHTDGHFGKCKVCILAEAKERRMCDPERARAKARERYRKMRAALAEMAKLAHVQRTEAADV